MKLKEILNPPKMVKLFAAISSVILLRYSLTNLPADHPLSILSYVLSTYTLITLIIAMIRWITFILTDYQPKTMIGHIIWMPGSRSLAAMCFSVIYNLIIALIYLVTGIRENLLWDITVGAYYSILTVNLAFLLYHRFQKDLDQSRQIKVFRFCAVMLLVLDLLLGLRAYQITWKEIAVPKNQVFMIAAAVWTFYNTVTCIIQSVRNRNIRSYLLSSVIAVKFATSMVSLFTLQTSMLCSFGAGTEFSHRMNLITGNAVFFLIFFECMMMLKKTQKRNR